MWPHTFFLSLPTNWVSWTYSSTPSTKSWAPPLSVTPTMIAGPHSRGSVPYAHGDTGWRKWRRRQDSAQDQTPTTGSPLSSVVEVHPRLPSWKGQSRKGYVPGVFGVVTDTSSVWDSLTCLVSRDDCRRVEGTYSLLGSDGRQWFRTSGETTSSFVCPPLPTPTSSTFESRLGKLER